MIQAMVINLWRERNRYRSVKEVAEKSAVTTSTISDILNGNSRPSLETIARLEVGLGVYLWPGVKPPVEIRSSFYIPPPCREKRQTPAKKLRVFCSTIGRRQVVLDRFGGIIRYSVTGTDAPALLVIQKNVPFRLHDLPCLSLLRIP